VIFTRFGDTLHPDDEEAKLWLLNAQEGDRLTLKAEPKRRSLDQNALFQKWARTFAAHVFKVKESEVTDTQHEAMKISLQRKCYAQTGWKFLIVHYPDAFGGESKPQRAPTSKMEKGELHSFLDWVQMFAAEDGLTLESLGEYADLQERQVA
jgi:hypothetical protein